jgi:hypothetical protein
MYQRHHSTAALQACLYVDILALPPMPAVPGWLGVYGELQGPYACWPAAADYVVRLAY